MEKKGKWNKQYLNDPRTSEEIIKLALNESGRTRRELLDILQFRGTREVFDLARQLCESKSPKQIKLGAVILGRLGSPYKLFIEDPTTIIFGEDYLKQFMKPERLFVEEILSVLFKIIDEETDVEIVESAAHALGSLHDVRAVEHLIKLKKHSSKHIRGVVAFGMVTFQNEQAISTLIELSKDEDDYVRSWTTFLLGSDIEIDTREIRDALFARIEERGSAVKDEIRGQAFVGLAIRGDERVIEPLLKELTSNSVGELAVTAAREIADEKLLPALLTLEKWWEVDKYLLNEAILACQDESKAERNGNR